MTPGNIILLSMAIAVSPVAQLEPSATPPKTTRTSDALTVGAAVSLPVLVLPSLVAGGVGARWAKVPRCGEPVNEPSGGGFGFNAPSWDPGPPSCFLRADYSRRHRNSRALMISGFVAAGVFLTGAIVMFVIAGQLRNRNPSSKIALDAGGMHF